jgi:hypothetical protein
MDTSPDHRSFVELARLVGGQPGWRPIGQILVDLGHLDQAGLSAALRAYRETAAPVGLLTYLVDRGDLTAGQALHALTEQVMSGYLPALARGWQAEREMRARVEQLEGELRQAYSTALQTVATLQDQFQRLSGQLELERQRAAALAREVRDLRLQLREAQRKR